ncbi:AMP-binding protein [Lichenibacterium ramalinae]|nr:AMP-binding protein [Lichenibacterium ramalinae]
MLSRRALSAVLQSLLAAELRVARGRAGSDTSLPRGLPPAWPESMPIGTGAEGLGCDSLDTLWLAAAVNEMFHLHEAGCDTDLPAEATFGGWMDRIEAGWRSGVAALTLTTSGTTGQPKRCRHAGEALLTEAAYLGRLFRDRRRVVTLVPAHHAFGLLFAALLPDALGVPHVDATGFGASEVARTLAPGDLVVTVPERWLWLERSLPGWPEDVEGAVSTAPCPPPLIAALHERGLAGMTEVYGSSETAGVAVRRWPEAAYTLMPHWDFAAPLDDATPEILHRSGRRAGLPDRIRSREGRRFCLAGRRDGAVQVGGINVHPDRVAERLRGRPGVHEAAVRLMRPDEGTRLKAFVVPEAGADVAVLRDDLSGWIRAELPVAERPVAIAFGPRLPTGPLGKASDW